MPTVFVVRATSVATGAAVAVACPVFVRAAAEIAADCEPANPATPVPMISPAQPTAAFSGPATRKRRNGRGEEKRERQTERSTCSIGSGGGWRMARKTKAIRSRRGDAGEDQWECHLGWHPNGARAL